MIRFFYEYIYFNLYQWSLKVNGEGHYNNYSASLMMTLIMCFNLTTLFSIFHMIVGWPLPAGIGVRIVIVGLVIFISVANYKYFSYQDRGLKLVAHYKAVSGNGDRASLIVGLLVFGSLMVLFLTWFLGMQLL